LQKYYDDHIAPNRIWIAASSPLPFNDFLKLLNPFVSDWDAKLPSPKYPPDISKTWDKSTEFINKESNQSAIVMGHFGEKRFNKDKYKIILADEILGGSTFGSKLGDHIRTDLGLAYSIQSDFGFDREYAPFQIITQTKTQSTVRTVKEIQKILKDMVENLDISNDELDLARERLINQLIFQYDDTFDIVTMRLTYDYHGYPPNYLKIFQKEIEAVTLPQIKDILAIYFFPEKLKIMIVGDRAKIKDLNQLEGFVEIPLDDE